MDSLWKRCCVWRMCACVRACEMRIYALRPERSGATDGWTDRCSAPVLRTCDSDFHLIVEFIVRECLRHECVTNALAASAGKPHVCTHVSFASVRARVNGGDCHVCVSITNRRLICAHTSHVTSFGARARISYFMLSPHSMIWRSSIQVIAHTRPAPPPPVPNAR